MQIKRYIALLLFTCFTVYLGHNLIPHHHHSDASASPDQHACPSSHHEHHDESSGSKHCHAFNDLNFVKDSRTGVPDPLTVQVHFLEADPSYVMDPLEDAEAAYLYRLKIPIYSALCSGPPSLRAPPPVA